MRSSHPALRRIRHFQIGFAHAPQRGVRSSLVALLRDGLLQACLGLVELAQILEDVAEGGQREWEIGAESNSFPTVDQGLR